MTFTTFIHLVNLFITSGSDLPTAVEKFGKVDTLERNNVHLVPLQKWDAQSITLEVAPDGRTVAGIIFTLDRPRAILPTALSDAWGTPTAMPSMSPSGTKTLRYDFRFTGGTGIALVDYDGSLARNEMQIRRVIMRRFPNNPVSGKTNPNKKS